MSFSLKYMFRVFRKGVEAFQLLKRFVDKIIAVVGYIINGVSLTIVYVIGIGTISVTAKILGKHFLPIKKEAATYWIDKEKKNPAKSKYYRQF